MKKGLGLLLFFVLANTLLFAQPQTTRNISVGAWNIQWLGSPTSRRGTGVNGVEQKPADIARYIKASRVDVLALQEISDTDSSPFTKTNCILDKAFKILNSEGSRNRRSRWRYILFPKRSQTNPSQLTGIAWNARKVTRVGMPFRIPLQVPGGRVRYWDRWATAMKFRAGRNRSDFVIIPIHMKANTSRGAAQQRTREAQILVRSLASVRRQFSDQDIIIIGDANVMRATEQTVVNFTRAGFIDLNSSDRPTTTGGRVPFDRAFVATNQPEFRNAQMDVFKLSGVSRQNFKKFFSDHYMIRFLVRVLRDDD